VKVDVVEIGLVVLAVDLTLVDAFVVVLHVVNDQVPVVVSTYRLHFHSPVADERRRADSHWMNRAESPPCHLNA